MFGFFSHILPRRTRHRNNAVRPPVSGKLKMLKILELLRSTDADHPISTREIIARLNDAGIPAERKSVLRDINLLTDSGCEILKDPNPRRGYYMNFGVFENWEIKVLIDALSSGCFLSENDTRLLIDKLVGFAGPGLKKALGASLLPKAVTAARSTTKYAIDAAITAISRKKMLSFRYSDLTPEGSYRLRKDGKVYTISPYMLLWHDRRYYLAANTFGHNNVSVYRLDRMQDVTLLTEHPARGIESLEGYSGETWLSETIAGAFNMFMGNRTELELVFGPEALGPMIDYFGASRIVKNPDGSYTVKEVVLESEGLSLFLLQYAPVSEVISPPHIREKIAELLLKSAQKYACE